MGSPLLASRNHACRPGRDFRDGIGLPGWEGQSVWGYDTAMGSFFAQLWPNGSTSDVPEIWLSGSAGSVYPWPGSIALEIVERLNEDPVVVVHGLGLAAPHPTLRPEDETIQRIRELGKLGPPARHIAGQIRALGWTQGLVECCPGSRRPWSHGRRPSPAQANAEHHLVTGRVDRGDDRELDSGAADALAWALGRTAPPGPSHDSRGRGSPDPPTAITVTASPVTGPARAWLDLPFTEKDDAKALGARWDADAGRWYAPPAEVTKLARWAALPGIPDLLPGEDRSFGAGLFVDLVPSSCWFTNVRSCVVPRDWERLRRMITSRAGKRCEVCGQTAHKSTRRWLEAHERWAYDDLAGVQALRRLICLCTPCHTVTHLGLAGIRGQAREALAHLRTVTDMTDQQVRAHIDDAGTLWRARSARTWTLDLSILTTAGVTLAPPPASADRAGIAAHTLRNLHRPG